LKREVVAGPDRAGGGMSAINPIAIEAALRELQKAFPDVNERLFDRRDPLADEVIDNMLAGYAVVDRWVAEGVDICAMGHSHHWLQLNAVVLCGEDTRALERNHRLLEATETRFYEEPEGGIGDVMEWYALNQHETVWFRAAGVYNRILSQPQLFIEGNHRTGALIVSYLLLREGEPPFVLTEKNAKGFFDPSSLMKKTKKRKLVEQFKFRRLTRAFAEFLETDKNLDFLASSRQQGLA
jgi:hypothetical protein